jgi:Ni/Fe-hydrogenase subunit HybB-like protein
MEIGHESEKTIKFFAPFIERINSKTRLWVSFLVLIILLGAIALTLQMVRGHVVTGMRDHAVWGLYISNFIYFIGVSYSAAVLAAIFYFFKISWAKPIIRIAALTAMITGIIGPVFILLCIGRFERIYSLFINARVQSPITWDVMVISTYLVGITTFVFLLLLKDFAVLRDTNSLEFPRWRKKLYRVLSIGYKGAPSQERKLEKCTKTIAFIMLPKIILAFSVLSWIFGMTLRPGWHSAIFGPSYVTASSAAGIGLIISMMWFFRNYYGLKNTITDTQFINMGYLMLLLVSIYGYFAFSEFVTNWYVSGKWESRVMATRTSFSGYGYWTLTIAFFTIFLPIVVTAIKRFRKPKWISLTAFLMLLAMWVHRYLIIVPTLETPLLPIQDTRTEYISYSPTWVEWALTFAGIATFLLFFTIVTKLVTILPIADQKSKEKEPVIV